MNAPRILLAGAVLAQPMGGVRRHHRELLPRLARALRDAGGSLAVLEGRGGLPFELDGPIERLRSDVPLHPSFLRAIAEPRAIERALRDAARTGHGFDLVHFPHFAVPRRLSLPYTVTLHDLRNLDPALASRARRAAASRWIARAVRGAARVIVVSETVRRELVARFELDPARVALVSNAADHFEPLARERAGDAPIVHVGHVEARKNLEVVVRALARDPSLPPLVAHGAPKARERERLEALARALGVAARVRFAGAFAEHELAAIYAGAACAVFPSRLEGFGIGVLEAQRARVPVAISTGGALVEVAGSRAPRFEVDDPAGCARALREALATESRELERAARETERFRWEDSARSWFEIACAARG